MESRFLNQEAYKLAKAKAMKTENNELQKTLTELTQAIAEERQEFYGVMTELMKKSEEYHSEISLLKQRLDIYVELDQLNQKDFQQLHKAIRIQGIIIVLGALTWIVTLLM